MVDIGTLVFTKMGASVASTVGIPVSIVTGASVGSFVGNNGISVGSIVGAPVSLVGSSVGNVLAIGTAVGKLVLSATGE
jgi:hypothetical protein